MPSGNEKGARRAGLWRAVFWIAIAVFVVAAGALGYMAYTYWHADQGYQSVAARATSFGGGDGSSSGSASSEEDDLAGMTVDWDYLRSLNPDVVAWVYVPGTRIDYPVAQAADNDYYLHHDFSEQGGFGARGGSIFLEASNAADLSDANNVLYGHHMRDGSMFAALSTQLSNQEEFNAHRTLYVLTPTMNYECETFALVLTNGSDAIVQTNFTSDDERALYILDKEERSEVEPDEGFPDPQAMGKLFTLATCDYSESNGRAVLFASVVAQSAPNNG